ncbi:MAG: site-specific integrase [Phycisphaeraceae bacterium]
MPRLKSGHKPKLSRRPDGTYYITYRGRKVTFGSDEEVAHKWYAHAWPEIQQGLRRPKPPADVAGNTVQDVLEFYLSEKVAQLDRGELAPVTYRAYKSLCDWLWENLGEDVVADALGPAQWAKLRAKMSSKWRGEALNSRITWAKQIFRWAHDPAELLAKPPQFGKGFKGLGIRDKRARRIEKGKKSLNGEEYVRLLAACPQPLRTLVLLGLNCALHAKEAADLRWKDFDLQAGLLISYREKTKLPRMAWLWPETLEGLELCRDVRPSPSRELYNDRIFLTRYGNPFVREELTKDDQGRPKITNDSAVSKELKKVTNKLDLPHTFKDLRSGFKTYSRLLSTDAPAVSLVMGHAQDQMGEVYDLNALNPPKDVWGPRVQTVCAIVRSKLLEEAGLSPEKDRLTTAGAAVVVSGKDEG